MDRVKGLVLLPTLALGTTQQVADFYKVPEKTIRSLHSENKEELELDGTRVYTRDEVVERLKLDYRTLVKTQYKVVVTMDNGDEIQVANRGLRLFTKRAILRVGMLLRDSEVAKEVRTVTGTSGESSSI